MAFVYITEQRSVLRKTGDRLIVKKDDETLLDIQCHKVESVLIFGNVQFTTQAVQELFEHGIEMAIFTRNGRLIGQLTSPVTKNVDLRIAQFRKFENQDFKLDLSKRIVIGKIENSISVIRRYASNHPDPMLNDVAKQLTRVLPDIEAAHSTEQLLGIEGSAARLYYGAFSGMLSTGFMFPGRKKRPATDPVNAVLSLSYTLAFNEIASLLDGLGFDPYIGFFHKPDYGRASLAADLLEEFRAPLADRLTLNLFNRSIFKVEDFKDNPQSKAVYLTRSAMQRYFSEYESLSTTPFSHPATGETATIRKCFRMQAQALAASIIKDEAYVPFSMPT